MNELTTWEIRVPIFKNKLILKQLCIAIGLPFGILLIVMLIIQAYYGIMLIILTMFLSILVVLLLFKGTYDVRYVINEKGILCKNLPRQAKRVKNLSVFTVIFSIFTRSYTSAGAAMLSGTRTSIFLSFKQIRKATYIEKQKSILVYGGFSQNIAVFCTNDNYDKVKMMITEKMGGE